MVRFSIIIGAAVLGVAAFAAAPAKAVDPAQYGGGKCHEMAQNHDPSTLYVGRFAAEADDPGETGQTSEVACFTDHKQCIQWIDRDSGEGDFGHIYQMSCHRGT